MRMRISHQHRLDFQLKDHLLFRYLFVVLFYFFTANQTFAGEQLEIFGIHLDQNPDVIKSKIIDRFDKKWGCKEHATLRKKFFACGGNNILNSVIYYYHGTETSVMKFSCTIYGGCGGEDALEQVRRILEDRWNIKFSEKSTEMTDYFFYENHSTEVDLTKFSVKFYHKNKNKNNPVFD